MLHSVSGAERGTEMRHSRKCLKSHPLYCCRKSKALHSRTQSPTQSLSGLNSLNKSLTGSYKQQRKTKRYYLIDSSLLFPISVFVCYRTWDGWMVVGLWGALASFSAAWFICTSTMSAMSCLSSAWCSPTRGMADPTTYATGRIAEIEDVTTE